MIKKICPNCHGNGFIRVRFEAEKTSETCKTCHSQGEITTKEFNDYYNEPQVTKISQGLSRY